MDEHADVRGGNVDARVRRVGANLRASAFGLAVCIAALWVVTVLSWPAQRLVGGPTTRFWALYLAAVMMFAALGEIARRGARVALFAALVLYVAVPFVALPALVWKPGLVPSVLYAWGAIALARSILWAYGWIGEDTRRR